MKGRYASKLPIAAKATPGPRHSGSLEQKQDLAGIGAEPDEEAAQGTRAAEEMVYQGMGAQARALFDRNDLPAMRPKSATACGRRGCGCGKASLPTALKPSKPRTHPSSRIIGP